MSVLPATATRLDEIIDGYFGLLPMTRYESLMAALEAARAALDYDRERCDMAKFDPQRSREAVRERVGEDALREFQAREPDRAIAGPDVNIIRFNNLLFPELAREMARSLEQEIRPTGRVLFNQSGRIWYPDCGYMGWHHNANVPGWRIYCNHAVDHERSFFRYLDPQTNEIVTSWDQQGWNFRIFRTDAAPLWHCVYSETDRLSFGFKMAFG